MKIEIIRFNASTNTWVSPNTPTPTSTSCSNDVIFVTPDWRLLSGITGSGFLLPPSFNISNKDRIRVSFSGGAATNTANSNYLPLTAGLPAGTDMFSQVTFNQDPFTLASAGNPGPYSFYRTYANPYDNLTTQIGSGLGTRTNNAFASQEVEFIVTDDLTIDWEISL
jgi:hypothetical protein